MTDPAAAAPEVSTPTRGADTATTFEPRRCAAAPKQFGKSGADLLPTSGMHSSDPRFVAAQFQHRICNAVRESLLAGGMTIEEFARELKAGDVPGAGSDRLGRVLRGETLMQIADLVALAARVSGVRTILMSEGTWTAPTQPTGEQPQPHLGGSGPSVPAQSLNKGRATPWSQEN